METSGITQHIIKAELLWSRRCKLNCSYCSMVTNEENNVTCWNWFRGIANLKALDCSFLAIYGAEPLEEFDKLPQVINFAENIGIKTTVITSGITNDLEDKLRILYQHGLRSITTSYDFSPTDRYSRIKTDKALSVIDMFRSHGPVRDSAVVMTLTKENYRYLPETIEKMSAKNIWTFFDLIHPDRGQPGSKVKNTNIDLLFDPSTIPDLIKVLLQVENLKDRKYLCHASKGFINLLGEQFTWNKNPYSWKCANEPSFPSWVTVDCDGRVYPCDDFCMQNIADILVWDLADRWQEFCATWGVVVRNNCPGCLWGTHYDADLIKSGLLPLGDYIHGMEEKV